MIKFAYFDVGGVFVWDFSQNNKWEEMKKRIGVKPKFDKEFDKFYNACEKKDLCLSRHVDSLIPVLSQKFGTKFPKKFSMLNYFVKNFDKNISLWPVINEIKKKNGILEFYSKAQHFGL